MKWHGNKTEVSGPEIESKLTDVSKHLLKSELHLHKVVNHLDVLSRRQGDVSARMGKQWKMLMFVGWFMVLEILIILVMMVRYL